MSYADGIYSLYTNYTQICHSDGNILSTCIVVSSWNYCKNDNPVDEGCSQFFFLSELAPRVFLVMSTIRRTCMPVYQWSDFLHNWQSLCQSQHVVANNSFCGTCYIFSRGRTLMYIVLWDFHSLGTGTFSVVSDFFLWFLAILKSVSTALLVYVLQLSGVYFCSSDFTNVLIKC